MDASFVGRTSELVALDLELERVVSSGAGRMVLVRGRRQVGKSRLLTEWLRRTSVPSVYFTASRRSPEREAELFTREVAESTLPAAPSFAAAHPVDWDDALSLVAATYAQQGAAVVVIDEFPYLLDGDSSIEATVQKVWDRKLSALPLLLVLVGSDLAMMQALTTYDRPLFGRPSRELVVEPLGPADIAELAGLDAVDAIDAHLLVGGFPGVLRSWTRGETLREFVDASLAEPTSPLVVMGERSLAAEFPTQSSARRVLDVVGAGRRTFRAIADRAAVSDASLTQALATLTAKRVIAVEDPLSTAVSRRLRRYRVADPYLRSWLRFIGPHLDDIVRGRPDLASDALWRGWSAYRGLAVEPLVRDGIARLLPDDPFGAARRVGSWWNRAHEVEVDLVGMPDPAVRVAFVGSVKWRDRGAFDEADARALGRASAVVGGVDDQTLRVGVSRSGFDTMGLDVRIGPEDLL